MDEFFRFTGERLMIFLILALIGVFLSEIRAAQKAAIKRCLETLGIFWTIEIVHVLMSGLMYHVLYGGSSFPALETLFRSAGLIKMYTALKTPSFYAPVSGALAYAGHAIGKTLFGEFILGGFLLSEGMSAAACCLIDARLRERYSDEAARAVILLLLMLPGAIFLFLPGWGALLFLGAALLFYFFGRRLPRRAGLRISWAEGAILVSAVLTMAVDYALVSGSL